MKFIRFSDSFRKGTLYRKLALSMAVVVLILLLVSLGSIALVTYRTVLNEREQSIRSIGFSISKLVARPLSIGDFALTEQIIRANKIPAFIHEISVLDANNQTIAGAENEANACQVRRDRFFSILNQESFGSPEKSRVRLKMTVSSCDLRHDVLTMSAI